jgi:hypothetical protein
VSCFLDLGRLRPSLYAVRRASASDRASYLDIQKIEVKGKAALWTLGRRSEPYGNALTIQLPEPLLHGDEVSVDVCQSPQWDDLTMTGPSVDDGQVHRSAVARAGADAEQEASVHVFVARP